MEHFLEDLIVVDAATFLAGPGAATMLGDFGAKVIKIEPPAVMVTEAWWGVIPCLTTGC